MFCLHLKDQSHRIDVPLNYFSSKLPNDFFVLALVQIQEHFLPKFRHVNLCEEAFFSQFQWLLIRPENVCPQRWIVCLIFSSARLNEWLFNSPELYLILFINLQRPAITINRLALLQVGCVLHLSHHYEDQTEDFIFNDILEQCKQRHQGDVSFSYHWWDCSHCRLQVSNTVLTSVPESRQCMNIQQVLCLLSLQWITVTCWTVVLRTNQWHPAKNVWTPLTSPCWRPTPSSHHCRSLRAWVAWPSLQRGCPCSTLMSFSRWDLACYRHWHMHAKPGR